MPEETKKENEAPRYWTRINGKQVDVVFNEAVVRLSLTPSQARQMAKVLVIKADLADKK